MKSMAMLISSSLNVNSLAQRYSLDAQQVGLVYLAVAAPGFIFIPVVVSSSIPTEHWPYHRVGVSLKLTYAIPPRAFSSTNLVRENALAHVRVPSLSGLAFSASTSCLTPLSWLYSSALASQ